MLNVINEEIEHSNIQLQHVSSSPSGCFNLTYTRSTYIC